MHTRLEGEREVTFVYENFAAGQGRASGGCQAYLYIKIAFSP